MNAITTLLSLPQEVKDQIYELILGHHVIHVHHQEKPIPLWHCLCMSLTEEDDAQKHYEAPTPWTNEGSKNPDLVCSAILAFSAFKLNFGLIRTCRLIYHDAKLVPYRHNTFSFTTCEALTLFLECTPAAVEIRSLRLEILIESREHLDSWDICLAKVATTMSSLRNVHINIEQISGENWYTRHVRSRPTFDVMDVVNNGQFKATLLRLAALELRDAKVTLKVSSQSYWPPDHSNIHEEDYTRLRMLCGEVWAKEVEEGLLVKKKDDELNKSSMKERV
jgi:hypothetical protein